MKRCVKCAMPDTRPDHVFEDGVCPACLNYARRPKIDWEQRHAQLEELLDRHHGEVLVPSSGGKDSHYQVLKLQEMGAHVTIVTATTCHLTDVGRANIDNLARFATTIEVTPNRTVRAKLNYLSLEWVGDISWPEHASIFSTPFRVAADLGINLIMFGENPQDQYGGPRGTEDAVLMTERWVSEFGGFLGLRTSDFVGVKGITRRDMQDYEAVHRPGVEAHFLGQYVPWDSHENAKLAKAFGMIQTLPNRANWWHFENMDNAQTALHDHFMYRKYGYGRGCTQISVDVRAGKVGRLDALSWVHKYDGSFPDVNMGVTLTQILDRIGMERDRFIELLNQYTNRDLFDDEKDWRPIPKC